jgi:hypothetical protein
MTFREFIEQSLSDFEQQLRREEPEGSTIEMRLRGARQFALLLLGEPQQKGETTTRRPQGEATSRRSQGDATNRRFGGPRN